MNYYKNLINLVKPEFKNLYYLEKKVNNDNSFGLFYKHKDFKKGHNSGSIIIKVRNPQNPVEVHKKGENPYISECSSTWNPDIYRQLNIPTDVSEFIYYLIDNNNSKNEFHLFFENIFNKTTSSLKQYRYTTNVKVLISKDFNNIEYMSVSIISDIDFKKEMPTFKDTSFTRDFKLFERVTPYMKTSALLINLKTREVFNEDKNGQAINVMDIDAFKNQNILNTDRIKQLAKDALVLKMSQIDKFEWSA